jgi:hypothetical protein
MSNLTGYNPLQAPEPKPPVRRNFVRCTVNEITDMPLRLKEKSNIPANEHVDFWHIGYETLDAKFPDGSPLSQDFGSRLFSKDGDQLGNDQRPFVCAQAFAGLGIIVFPEDPRYDADAVIGKNFIVEGVEFATGRPAPLPIEVLPDDYQHPADKVRTITPRNSDGTSGVTAAAPVTTEINNDASLLVRVVTALNGVNVNDNQGDAVVDALRENDLGRGMTLNGAGLLGLAISGKLVGALVETGAVTVTPAGVIASS